MKKLLFVCASAFFFATVNAQSGNNQIGVGLDIGLPIGDFGDAANVGFGGTIKGLLGVGTAGQVTLGTGYTSFKAKGSTSTDKAHLSIIPILLGYRQNFSGFYIEPQAGYGIYGVKEKVSGVSVSNSEGAFTWAAGVGYAMAQGLDLGVRYQGATKDGDNTSLIGFHARWNFSLGGASATAK